MLILMAQPTENGNREYVSRYMLHLATATSAVGFSAKFTSSMTSLSVVTASAAHIALNRVHEGKQ